MAAGSVTNCLTVVVVLAAFAPSSLALTLQPARNFTQVYGKAGTQYENVTWSVSRALKNESKHVDLTDGLCRLTTTDPYIYNKVVQMLTENTATLIDYQLNFSGYTRNPLTVNVASAYDAKKWSRVTTAHGQTLLSLAFNYGVLSMMTLTLGTKTLYAELQDSPPGCMEAVSDRRKIDSVRRLLMRDFNPNGPITTVDDGRICNEIIENDAGYAKFRHNCCYRNSITGAIECTTEIGNIWLNLLYGMLIVVRLSLLCFGPSFFISAIESMSKDNIPYVVRLKTKLEKTVCFCYSETKLPGNLSAKRVLDLTTMKAFPKLRNMVRSLNLPLGKPVKVRFPQYDICVDYKRMLKENNVPVSLFQSLFRAIFLCQMRFVAPFKECCKTNMLYSEERSVPWAKFCRKFGKVLLIFLLPTPFYIRLIIFYTFEYDALESRKRAIALGGLKESYENSLIHYLTPTHSLFIFIYVVYGVTALFLAFMFRPHKEHRLQKVIVDSFRDLKRLNWTNTLAMFMANVIWPFKRFRLLGCLVCLVYWPIALPLTVIISVAYFIPTIYLTVRMAVHSKVASVVKARRSHRKTYKVRITVDEDVRRFETENVLKKLLNRDSEMHDSNFSLDDIDHVKPKEHDIEMDDDNASRASTIIRYGNFSFRRALKYVVSALMCIVSLYGVVVILSEVVGCFVEMVVFTVMGCIVNAGSLLRYVMLLVIVFVYCCDCFNNISKKYLKMNKALFSEVKGRVKDLETVTSLPSSLQENCGFKAQELNEQAHYEGSDDVAEKPPNHWMINDLVLFVDSEDTPRIPKQLFDEVTQIRVAGVPGPVYRGHIEAFRQLIQIVLFILFVFIVVLSFGAVYKISTTNQMLATLVGGFLPMILRTFLAPPAPDVELGTVSFKSKMDEVIKNFCQYWRVYDLPFELVPEDEDAGENERNDDKQTKTCDKPVAAAAATTIADESASYFNSNGGCGGKLAVRSETIFVDEYSPENDLITSTSIPLTTYYKQSTETVDGFSAGAEKVVRIESPPAYEQVDILIYLPHVDLQWLDEWSDLDVSSTSNVRL